VTAPIHRDRNGTNGENDQVRIAVAPGRTLIGNGRRNIEPSSVEFFRIFFLGFFQRFPTRCCMRTSPLEA
jgi:hypothetical protein